MKNLVLVGFGGHAKSVADCIERQGEYNIVGYTDINDNNVCYKYLGTDSKLSEIFASGVEYAFITVGFMGEGSLREKLYADLKTIGFQIPTIIDPSSVIASSAEIDEGTFIGKKAVINAEACIGKNVIINTSAVVEHETQIKDYSHVAVGAIICGNAKVGKSCLVGAGATVIQEVTIGNNSVVAAGSTVINSLCDNSVYYGIK
ncbi:MAG: acetyltransferase [Erysipelotrichaceae bacterium]|nr:acetyltransferase [Erysipelotrichaceae bacterium]